MPLLWLSLAFICGIGLASLLNFNTQLWAALAAASMLLVVFIGIVRRVLRLPNAFRRALDWVWQLGLPQEGPGLPVIFLWMAGALFLGAARYQADRPVIDSGWLANYHERIWAVSGELVDLPDKRDGYMNILIDAHQLSALDGSEAHEVHGLVLARLEAAMDLAYGDEVQVVGLLTAPEAGEIFSYQAYLARKGIYSMMPRVSVKLVRQAQGWSFRGLLFQARELALNLCYRLYPDPEASLIAGVLLGADRGLPERVSLVFQASGVSHILAISGFNITLLAGFFLKIFEQGLGRWRGALAAAFGITAYTLMTGAEASAVRAAWMGGLSLLAAQIGRQQDGMNSLGMTAAVMAWFEPDVLWDVGFQLSFASTLGLIVMGGPLSNLAAAWLKARLPEAAGLLISRLLSEYVLQTLAAQVLTLPLMLLYFQRFSLIALAANLVILPAQPALMIWSGLSVLAGLVWQPFGQMVALLAWPLARFTIAAAEIFARIPGAQAGVAPFSPLVALFMYILLIGLFTTRQNWQPILTRIRSLVTPGLALFILTASAFSVWKMAAQLPDGRLHLVMLDVSANGNSAEALLIESPDGRFVLVNGGPSLVRLGDSLGQRLPLARRRLDWLVVAGHSDSQIESLSGMLLRFTPGMVLWAGDTHTGQQARYLISELAAAGIPVTPAQTGQRLDLGEGAKLEILFANQTGAVLLLEWGNFRALLPVGADEQSIQVLQGGKVPGRVNVLLLPHAGEMDFSPAEWRYNLQPQAVLISAAVDDRFGRPDSETLDIWRDFTILRTDQHGWVDISTDGSQMWINVEKR